MSQPTWVVIWVFWLVFLNIASAAVFAWRHVEARWVLAAMLANMPFMNLLFSYFDYTRILGLSHIILWTPLLIYLWQRRQKIQLKTPFGIYIHALFISNFISLIIDYIDVIRYLLGDIGIVGS
ncbi:MAG: hypothetical protein WD750_08465 [Gammaproteobacteria bacterium]